MNATDIAFLSVKYLLWTAAILAAVPVIAAAWMLMAVLSLIILIFSLFIPKTGSPIPDLLCHWEESESS